MVHIGGSRGHCWHAPPPIHIHFYQKVPTSEAGAPQQVSTPQWEILDPLLIQVDYPVDNGALSCFCWTKVHFEGQLVPYGWNLDDTARVGYRISHWGEHQSLMEVLLGENVCKNERIGSGLGGWVACIILVQG